MSTKRKAQELSDTDDCNSPPKASMSKKAKPSTVAPSPNGFAPNGQPNNKVLPANVVFSAKNENCLRIATWNICGLAASQKKGFKNYVDSEDADILILSETKVNDIPADPSISKRYPHRYWSIGDKKSYAGCAVLSKYEPISISKTLPGHPNPRAGAGRIITLEFDKCFVVGTYVVNAGQALKTLSDKKAWNIAFEAYIRELDAKKPVIWTGDVNVAPTEIDLANPKTNWNKTPGYTEVETTAFAHLLDPSTPLPTGVTEEPKYASRNKFVDVWRARNPKMRHYTYWSYRFNARVKGLGWRLDMFVLSERITSKVQMCEIRSEIWGASDHCPVTMEIEKSAVL